MRDPMDGSGPVTGTDNSHPQHRVMAQGNGFAAKASAGKTEHHPTRRFGHPCLGDFPNSTRPKVEQQLVTIDQRRLRFANRIAHITLETTSNMQTRSLRMSCT